MIIRFYTNKNEWILEIPVPFFAVHLIKSTDLVKNFCKKAS